MQLLTIRIMELILIKCQAWDIGQSAQQAYRIYLYNYFEFFFQIVFMTDMLLKIQTCLAILLYAEGRNRLFISFEHLFLRSFLIHIYWIIGVVSVAMIDIGTGTSIDIALPSYPLIHSIGLGNCMLRPV